jgi:hypothetical protein
MKKLTIFLTIIFTFMCSLSYAAAPLYQQYYRWINDDGSANAGTFAAAENTTLEIYPSVKKRLRIKFGTPFSYGNDTYTIQYSMDGGAYANLLLSVPIPPTVWYLASADSTYYTNGTATTERLSVGLYGSWVAGYAQDGASAIPTGSLNMDNKRSELEYCIIFSTDAIGHSFNFRLINSGSDPWIYSVTPNCTVVKQQSLVISGDELVISGENLVVKVQ